MSKGRGSSGIAQISHILNVHRGQIISDSFTSPPPTYPETPAPEPFEVSEKDEYLVMLQKEFLEWIQNSSFHMKDSSSDENLGVAIQRYTDKYKVSSTNNQRIFDWKKVNQEFPEELTGSNKSLKKSVRKMKKKKNFLKVNEDENQNEDLDKESVASDQADDRESLEDGLEAESQDDEEVNDYAETYFDNGENYVENDEENNEGPIY